MTPTHDRLVSLRTALARLGDALAQPKTEWTRDSAIQRFAFTFELAWKAVATVAQAHGVEARSPREAFKQAFALSWVYGRGRPRGATRWPGCVCSTIATARTIPTTKLSLRVTRRSRQCEPGNERGVFRG